MSPAPRTRIADQALALGGLFQAVQLVKGVARHGLVDATDFETSIESVLRVDAESVPAVYGGAQRVASGLRVLLDQLGAGAGRRDLEITGYASRLLGLERRLAARPDVLDRLRGELARIGALAAGAGTEARDVVAELAAAYVDTIGSVGPRVMVSGEPAHLRDRRNAERVRALLLAGVRSTVLWRQLGGGRLQLFLRRERIARAARELLSEAAG